jgi:uncharacterized protein (UPF0335 family)
MAMNDGGAAPREGHNSGVVDAGHLRSFVERVEHLHSERQAISEDISEVYKECKATGFDAKIIKKVVALRRMDRDKRIEEETILDLYLSALGEA